MFPRVTPFSGRESSRANVLLTITITLLFLLPGLKAHGQVVFPTFAGGVDNGFKSEGAAVGLAAFGSSVNPNSLLLAYAGNGGGSLNELALAYSVDGSTFAPLQADSRFSIWQHSNDPAASQPAICVYNGNAYIAFADGVTDGLRVIEVSRIANSAQFLLTSVIFDNSVQLTSAPGMAVSPNGAHLIIRYGTSTVPNVKNATFVTEYPVGSSWSTYQSNAVSPQQPALIYFNGAFYAIDKADADSSNGIWVSQMDENGIYIGGTAYQISGCYTNAGLSAVIYHGEILIANQSTQGSKILALCGSTDGVHWTGTTTAASNYLYGAPALSLFGTGVTLAYTATNSTSDVITARAPN